MERNWCKGVALNMSPSIASFLSTPIPNVDPEDIKRIWDLATSFDEPGVVIDNRVLAERCNPGAHIPAVYARAMLVIAMIQQGRLNRCHDKVFAVAATVPLTPQNGAFAFDGDAFLAALE
jgi:hypothetical protein